MQSLVSVIIPARQKVNPRTLASIREQTYKNVEVIVIETGGERSSRVNQGAKLAKGSFYYRVDSDFILEPTVIEEAVRKCEEGADCILIHNTSDPSVSVWSKISKIERDCYRDDPETSFARFVRRSAFWAVKGYDEKLNAEEDRDFSDRLRKAGFRFARIEAGELHVGEPKHLSQIVRKHTYYGSSFRRYISEHGTSSAFKLGPFRRAYIRHWREITPMLPLFIFYQFVRYVSAVAGLWIDLPLIHESIPDRRKLTYGCVIATRKLSDMKFRLPNSIVIAGNISVNECRNLGAAGQRTDLIAMVDDDNRLAPDALDEMAKVFTFDKNIGVVAPLTFDKDGKVWWTGGRFHWAGLYLIDRRIPDNYRNVDSFHNVFMVRREAFEKAGGFDTKRFEFYLAEADLAERMKALGYRFVITPKAKVWHNISSERSIRNLARASHIRGPKRAYLVGRNRLLFLRMHKGARTFLICAIFLLPFLTLFHVIGIVGARKFNLVRPYLKGVKNGLGNKL